MKIDAGRLANADDSRGDDIDLLAQSAGRVLADLCASQNLHAFVDDAGDLDSRLGMLAAELGWHLVGVPEELDGLGLGISGIAMLGRELGARLAPGGVIETTAALAWLAAQHGTDAIVRRLADVIGAGGSSIALPAFADSDGGDGSLAIAGGGVSGHTGAMLIPANAGFAIVPVEAGEAWAIMNMADPGIAVQPRKTWDRTRSIAKLALADAAPLHVVDGSDGQAGALLESIVSVAISADSLGGARSALDLAVAYTSERVQFGRPVGSNQALKHRAATAEVQIGAAADLLGYAVQCLTSGQPGAAAWTALAKAQACEAYRLAAEEDVLFHGGVGFTEEFDCHLFLKRANLNIQLAGGLRANRDKAAALFIEASRSGFSIAEIA